MVFLSESYGHLVGFEHCVTFIFSSQECGLFVTLRGFLMVSHETCDIIGSQYFDFIKLFFIFDTDLICGSNEQKETTLRSTPNNGSTKIPKNCGQAF
jgi:hypothetical protein